MCPASGFSAVWIPFVLLWQEERGGEGYGAVSFTYHTAALPLQLKERWDRLMWRPRVQSGSQSPEEGAAGLSRIQDHSTLFSVLEGVEREGILQGVREETTPRIGSNSAFHCPGLSLCGPFLGAVGRQRWNCGHPGAVPGTTS